MNGLVELTKPDDIYYDYCLWEYKPLASPDNKLRSANLLYHGFKIAQAPDNAYALVQAIRQGIGMFNTVWGVKLIGGRLRWEYYFYDYRRRDRERSIAKVLEAMRAFTPCFVPINEHLNYFMFSLDVPNDLLTERRELDEVHMYIGNPGSAVSSGICYSVTAGGMRLENFYFFFNALKHGDDITGKINSSVYFDVTATDLNLLLWPEMRGCQVIVIANKQGNDAIYFSRITVDQLLVFLKRMRYPQEYVSYVAENRSRLDHLLFDVGFDYRTERQGLVVLKSGFYGIF